MTLRTTARLAAFALLLAPGLAAAQTQGQLTLSIEELAPGPVAVTAGQAYSAQFTVRAIVTGIQCPQASSIAVDLALAGAGAAPAGVTPSIEPAALEIAIPQGVYGLPPTPAGVGGPLNASGSATLRVATTVDAAGNYPATVSASHAGGQPAGCVGTLPEASTTAPHQLSIRGAGTGTGTNTTGPGNVTGPGTPTNGTGAPPPAEPSRGLPGFEPLVLAGAAGVAVALRSRRRA